MLFDSTHDLLGRNGLSLGQEYLINDSGDVSSVHGAATSSATSGHGPAAPTTPPAPTIVGSASGLQFDLIWDSSVAKAPTGFTQAIIAAAQYYTGLFSTKAVIRIDVGYGEIAGSSLGAGALGESESYGYLTNYATVINALHNDNFAPALAKNEPTTAQFFVTSAEAKTMGLISGGGTSVDGFVGFSSAYPMSYTTAGPAKGSAQFDAIGIAEHEISEVLGRIGMEGALVSGKHTYTPLDLFIFKSPGVLELAGNGGYFSVNDGATSLGIYNSASANGGDIADWTSNTAPSGSTYDAYNAFTWPGYHGVVSAGDIIGDAALGLKLTPTGIALA